MQKIYENLVVICLNITLQGMEDIIFLDQAVGRQKIQISLVKLQMEKVKIPFEYSINDQISIDTNNGFLKPKSPQIVQSSQQCSRQKQKTRHYKKQQSISIHGEQSRIRITDHQYKIKNTSRVNLELLGPGGDKKMQVLDGYKLRSGFEQPIIKNTIKNYKVVNLTQQFINKLRRNATYRTPTSYEPFNQKQQQNEEKAKGFETNRKLHLAYLIANLINNSFCILLATLILAFQDTLETTKITYPFSGFNIGWSLFEIWLKLQRIPWKNGSISWSKYIFKIFIKDNLIMDFIALLVHFLALVLSLNFTPYLYGYFFLRIPSCSEKIKTLQVQLFDQPYLQNYWKLSKIVLTNFFLAHCIAIAFILMSQDQDVNWMQKKGIQNLQWYEQYIWAYYWATTTMLTVGFGDISPTSVRECLVLVVVQTLGCMTLAYNINCVGSILTSIEQKQNEKERGLNFLRKFYHGNEFESNLQMKLQKYIKQTFQIQTKHNFDEFDHFVQKLPSNLKQQFLRQAHHKIVAALPFIKTFTLKTTQALAQKLILKIAHPQQIICHPKMQVPLLVLKQGEMTFCPTLNNHSLSKIPIQRLIVQQYDTPFLLSLDFMRPYYCRKYNISSVKYSIYCEMSIEELEKTLKDKDVDFEMYFAQKHKYQVKSEDYQVIKCQFCQKRRHNKFQCPRLHYSPIGQHIINRHLHQSKKSMNDRMLIQRVKPQSYAYTNYRPIQLQMSIKQKIFKSSQIVDSVDIYPQDLKQIEVNLKPKSTQHLTRTRQQKHFLSNATQVMRNEMRNYMKGLLTEINQYQFWNIQSDKAHDYKFYFKDSNPKTLNEIPLRKTQNHPKTKCQGLKKHQSFNKGV